MNRHAICRRGFVRHLGVGSLFLTVKCVALGDDLEGSHSALPLPLTEYMGRTIAPAMTYEGAPWLIREEREKEERCTSVLKALSIRPGMTVCDMGCGNGFYSLKLAKLVGPRGNVLAVDIQPEMLTLLRARSEQENVTNITPVLGSVISPYLPHKAVDLILCVDVYHEFSHPVHMLKAMRQALAPSGRLVLVEFRAEDPSVPIKRLHKMSKQQVLKELPANGYRLVDEFDGLSWQHMMFFERDDK